MSYLRSNHKSGISRRAKKDKGTVNELVCVISAEYNRTTLWNILFANDDNIFEELLQRQPHENLYHVVKTAKRKWFLIGQIRLINVYRLIIV